MKKIRAAEEKQKQKEEEDKLEKRIQEQQERMKKEYEEEVAKKRAKEEAVSFHPSIIFIKIINQSYCFVKCLIQVVELFCFFLETKAPR